MAKEGIVAIEMGTPNRIPAVGILMTRRRRDKTNRTMDRTEAVAMTMAMDSIPIEITIIHEGTDHSTFKDETRLSSRPDDGTDEDDDNVDDNETDENLARRLGFHPIDNETIRAIGRLRSLTAQRSFERRDLENLGYLIDELIRLQHLETFSQGQLEQIIHRLRLHRPLGSLSQALTFIEDRLPRRSSRVQQEGNPNVFRVWQERERRSRLDSKDSLEDEGTGQHPSGQQLRDVTEINHPTPPVILANKSKVKQMARDIDTRSVPIRTNDHVRSTSPSPITTTRIPVSSFDSKSPPPVRRWIRFFPLI